MDTELLLELSAILFLILANGFFALSEFSIIASRKSKLKQQSEEGHKGSKIAEKLHENPDRFLASIQVGITLLAILAGVLSGATIVDRLEHSIKSVDIEFIQSASRSISVGLVALIITTVSVVFGELIPKYLALSNPERFAHIVAPPVMIFTKLTSFFSNTLSRFSNLFLKIFGVDTTRSGSTITEEEINHMILDGREKGIFDETEEQLIKSVFDFADSTVKRAMTPRIDVIGLTSDDTYDHIISTIIKNGYSRYPIYEDSIDNIIGVLYAKDLLHEQNSKESFNIKNILREIPFVPDSMPLSKLLNIFKKQKSHLAIVLDEFGGTAGIISLEDILEELVGEIQDEYDTEVEPLVKHSDNIAFVDGAVWPGDVNELLNSKLPEDNAETMAGLVINHLGTVPNKDQIIEIADIRISILEQNKNRLVRLKVEKIKQKNNIDGDN